MIWCLVQLPNNTTLAIECANKPDGPSIGQQCLEKVCCDICYYPRAHFFIDVLFIFKSCSTVVELYRIQWAFLFCEIKYSSFLINNLIPENFC